MNGAQTSGSIGSLDVPPDPKAMVSARFIKCSNRDVIRQIVQYNNTQNKVASADFRSTDPVQDRLRREFTQQYPELTYRGGRRGAATDNIPRYPNLISSDTVAQSLTAFHGRPIIAYGKKGDIWESNTEYSRVFSDQTHADHIVFVYALHVAITNKRLELNERSRSNTLPMTNIEAEALSFLGYRGAIYLLMAAVGKCIELILIDRPVNDLFLLRFNNFTNMRDISNSWVPIIDCFIAFRGVLQKPLETGLGIRSETDVDTALSAVKSLIEATKNANASVYRQFSATVLTAPRQN